jgi:hypothetical protein
MHFALVFWEKIAKKEQKKAAPNTGAAFEKGRCRRRRSLF